MDKIINDLLNTNARVIIPDFGAFIIKQKSPRLIVFNEFLRYNDGLLIDYLSVSEKISKEAAKENIVKYVEELVNKLNAGEEVVFEGIGKLLKESSGKFSLAEITASETEPKKKEKKKEIKVETVPEPKKEEKKEKIKEEQKPTPVQADEKNEELKPLPLDKEHKAEIELSIDKDEKKSSEPERKVQVKEDKISVTPIKTSSEKVTVVKPQPAEQHAKKVEHKSQSKKNTLQIIIWILLIVLVNAAIVAWFVFNDEITGFVKKNKKPHTELITLEEAKPGNLEESPTEKIVEPAFESAEKRSIIAKEPAKAAATSPSVPSAISGKKQYFIVAGCFMDENNADKLVIELRKDGYNAEKFGKIGNLHAVSYGSYAEKPAALLELKNIRNTGHTDAWIIYF